MRRLNWLKIPDMDRRLHEVIIKLGDGLCKYEGEHTDESIAREFDCAPSSVAKYRLQKFGRINKKSEHSVGYEELLDKYEELLERVQFIENKLNIKVNRHDTNCHAHQA